jgi:hypothetical protein
VTGCHLHLHSIEVYCYLNLTLQQHLLLIFSTNILDVALFREYRQMQAGRIII